MEAYFEFKKTGLSVEFQNLSTGGSVSHVYDFGDGNASPDPSPTHEYEQGGFYTVTLTVIWNNPDPALPPITETYSTVIGVADVEWDPLNQKVSELVGIYLPPNIDPEDVTSNVPNLLQKWQLFLQPLVTPAIELDKVHNQVYWPPLVNYLIAQLIAYDLILVAANQFLIGIGGTGGSTGSGGEVKRMRTGPAEVEWFQESETWTEVFKQGGSFDQLTQQICTLASRLRITLYICRRLSHSPVPPRIHKVPKPKSKNIFEKGKL